MKRVLLCGNSVLIAGLETNLAESIEFELHRIDDLTASHDFSSFDFVVFDINRLASDAFFSQFSQHPHLQLLSIDAATGTLTTKSGASYAVRSIDDIVQWLRAHSEVLSFVST